MLSPVHTLVACSALTFFMLTAGAAIRGKWWTLSGLLFGFGNREGQTPSTGMAGRADRAANNMIEGMAMFLPLMLAARFDGGHLARVELGANVFFYARLVYWPVYLFGIPYLRTAVWGVSVAGLVMIGTALL
ncbi:MAG TPA: MAPEG family protein [Myxococcota bacterium]|nr:MAPEG family protein [Myxococcota bacterium]